MAKFSIKTDRDKEIILSIIKYAMLTAIVVIVLFFGFRILWLLLPVVIGFVLAYASNKFSFLLYKLFRRKPPRSLSQGGDTKGYRIFKLLNFTLLLLVFMAFLVLVVFALISQVRNLIAFLSSAVPTFEVSSALVLWLKDISNKLGGFLPQSTIDSLSDELVKIQSDLLSLIPKFTTAFLNSVLSFIGNIPNVLFKVIVVVMSGYYFITDRVVIGRFMNTLMPSQVFVQKITTVVMKVSSSLFRVFGGYMVIMTVTFIEAFIGLTILRMPYAVVIALAVMLIDLLPAVGASACFYPIAIYMFVQGRPVDGFIALAFVGILTLVRTFMEPRIVGTAMKLHPLATLIAMILGVSVFGLAGFLGGPILLVLALGIMDSFGFQDIVRELSGKILNRVAGVSKDDEIREAAGIKTIRHIVMWKLKDSALGKDREANAEELKERLLALKPLIPQIQKIEVSFDTKVDKTAYDVVLISEFNSVEDLNAYKTHPDHVEVANFVKEITSSRAVSDFRV
jgi:sporulation integral membrane protein YtvI